MAKKIAVINDLSGFGKCSLTAAIPVISVMGSQPCPLPTAVLSSQTGYDSYYLDDYTDKMEFIMDEWKKMGTSFDGIYSGFVANEAQIDHIFRFLKDFYSNETFLLVDPVMGDNGYKYDMFTEVLLVKMKKLVECADVITPNLTELCLLADEDYYEVEQLPMEQLMEKVKDMISRINCKDSCIVVVTGLNFLGDDDTPMVGNLILKSDECRLAAFPYVGGSFSGTGDLFASILAGGMARGDDMFELCSLAGRFIEKSMCDSVAASAERNAGTEFEQNLRMLLP